MGTTISHSNLWVTDQDEALAFYTDKIGFEVREDVTVPEFNNYRWLTVGPPGQLGVQVILASVEMTPFPPETVATLKEMVAQGAAGGLILDVDDAQATYEELKGRGVEFTQEPTEQFYGIDAAFRDPFGNHIRVTQRTDR